LSPHQKLKINETRKLKAAAIGDVTATELAYTIVSVELLENVYQSEKHVLCSYNHLYFTVMVEAYNTIKKK